MYCVDFLGKRKTNIIIVDGQHSSAVTTWCGLNTLKGKFALSLAGFLS